jgi:hypothetical protein
LPGPARSFDWIQDDLYEYRFFGVAGDIGAWVLTGLAAGLAFPRVRAFRSPRWRRRTGILWDLLDTPSPLPRPALLTHGSQLMWASPRFFPALDGRRRNLHRWTDPLGGPVLAASTTGPVGPVLPENSPWQAW